MSDELFDLPESEPRPLSELDLARLQAAGADENDVAACGRVTDAYSRALLIDCFCEALPDNWRKLRCMVSYLLWRRDTKGAPVGGDVITNTVKGTFNGCKGNNTPRLIYTRLISIVRPDLCRFLCFDEESDSATNAVLESGWTPPVSVDWYGIKAQRWEVIEP
jgi:hypothetical protein